MMTLKLKEIELILIALSLRIDYFYSIKDEHPCVECRDSILELCDMYEILFDLLDSAIDNRLSFIRIESIVDLPGSSVYSASPSAADRL